jgi:hypothetical protein
MRVDEHIDQALLGLTAAGDMELVMNGRGQEGGRTSRLPIIKGSTKQLLVVLHFHSLVAILGELKKVVERVNFQLLKGLQSNY